MWMSVRLGLEMERSITKGGGRKVKAWLGWTFDGEEDQLEKGEKEVEIKFFFLDCIAI